MFGFRKITAVLLAFVMSMGVLTSGVYAGIADVPADLPVQTGNKTWSMSSNSDRTVYEKAIKWDGLYIEATPKIGDTDARTAQFDGTYLKVGGAANVVYFKVAGTCNIKVVYKSNSDKTARGVVIKDGLKAETLGTSPTVLNVDTTYSVDYTGGATTISITPAGGGISIKSIALTFPPKGDINSDGVINRIDANILLRHLSGLDELTDSKMLASAEANGDGEINLADVVWILNHKTGEDVVVDPVDPSDGTQVANEADLKAALSRGDKKIYVTDDIDITGSRVDVSKGNQELIGVPDEKGELPVLNFEEMDGETDIVNKSSSDGDVGVRISSANNVVKNLVIEKAHDNGIQIKGVNAVNNTVENCIVRYNNDSGIQVTGGACGTTLKGVYSYRNCDVYTLGGNADGFAIKLSAGPEKTTDTSVMDANKTVCIDCYAWENGDDGWDSFDYPLEKQDSKFKDAGGRWTYRVDYTNCMGWDNGTPENCMGYNDYVKGLPLDENLPFMMRFKTVYPEKYPDFVTKYNNGTLCSRTANASTYYSALDNAFGTIPTTSGKLKPSVIAASYWAGNPNGFKLGSVNTQSNSERHMYNCISFDHDANGFDRNNSGAKIWAENCISFGNKSNYYLDTYTAYKWSNIFGWSGGGDKKPTGSGVSINISTSGSGDKEATVRAAADRLVNYANNNTFVPSSVFGDVFN